MKNWKESKMIEDKDEILEAIRKLVDDNGYEIFYKWGESPIELNWITEERLHTWVKPKDKDNRVFLFDISNGSTYLRVTFADISNGNFDWKNCRDQNEMLDFIEECLRTRNKIA